MQGVSLRSQLRTNVPGDTRVSGRFTDTAGGSGTSTAITIVEGKNFTVRRSATGVYEVTFAAPVMGLVSAYATAFVATPGTAANNRWAQLGAITTNSSGAVVSVSFTLVDAAGAVLSLIANDGLLFECIVRDTSVTV